LFEGFRGDLAQHGCLGWPQLDEVCLFLGVPAEGGTPEQIEIRYLCRLWNAACQPTPDPAAIAASLRPENRPETLRAVPMTAFFPATAPGCRARLGALLEGEIAQVRLQSEQVQAESEHEEVGRLLEPLAVLVDPEAIKRFHRYQTDCRTLFHGSHNA